MASSASATDAARHSFVSGYASPRSPNGLRSQSVSSDRPSLGGMSTMSRYLRNPTPEAAYIAPSAASHIVSMAQDEQWESYIDEREDEDRRAAALVSVASLKLVNGFLDYILDCFLINSGSLSLSHLRPAVVKTLKPKLADELIAEADHELEEYTGSMEEDEIFPLASESRNGQIWDSEATWRVMRLRCMVYATLGEFEESDMEFFLENQGLSLDEDQDAKTAIFLTAILEGVGEKVLRIAGQAAHYREPVKRRPSVTSAISSQSGRLVVEELDTLKVASSPQLGRLWRSWRKLARSMTPSFSRSNLRNGMVRRSQRSSFTEGSQRSSYDGSEFGVSRTQSGIDQLLQHANDVDVAVQTPLPDDNDEREIAGEDVGEERSRSMASPTGRSRSFTSPPPLVKAQLHYRNRSLPPPRAAIYSTILVDRIHEIGSPTTALPIVRPVNAVKEVSPAKAKSRDRRRSRAMVPDEDGDAPELSKETIRPYDRVYSKGIDDDGADDSSLDAGDRDFSKPQIVSARKVSVESARVPHIVETRSRASSQAMSSYSIESTGHDDKIQHDPRTIGIARTHNRITPPTSRHGTNNCLVIMGDDGSEIIPSPEAPVRSFPTDRGMASSMSAAVAKKRRPENLSLGGQSDGGLRVHGGAPPPLTPLRELVEAAADTSDEASSVAPSHGTPSDRDRSDDFLPYQRQSRGSDRSVQGSSNDAYVTQPKRLDDALPALPQKDLRRTGNSPLQPMRDARGVVTQGANHVTRSTHSSSSGKAVAQRHSPSNDTDSLRSDQNSLIGATSHAESRGKSFEDLIRRDETIKYTLTPSSVRGTTDVEDMNGDRRAVPQSDHIVKSHSSKQPSNGSIARGILNNLRPSSSISSSVTATPASLGKGQAEPPSPSQPLASSPVAPVPLVKKYIPVSRPPPPAQSKSTRSIVAREARTNRESMAGFADWIRSTGPDGGQPSSAYGNNNRSVSSLRNGSRQKPNGLVSPTGLHAIIPAAPQPLPDMNPRHRLQARDARTKSNTNADLIDAIRQGPTVNGARVDRTNGAAVRGSQGDSTDEWRAPSVASSLQSKGYAASNSSRTPLVATRTIAGRPSYENGVATRGPSRAPDPYSLSDLEDPQIAMLKNSRRAEMSMMDFLRDGPPDEAGTSSVFDDIRPPARQSNATSAKTQNARTSMYGSTKKMPAVAAAAERPSNPRSNSSRLGRNANAEPLYDKAAYGYDAHTAAEPPSQARPAETARPRAPPVAVDIRAARKDGSNDLADFFRNSSPPGAPAPVRSGSVVGGSGGKRPSKGRESSGFGKMFGRKKTIA